MRISFETIDGGELDAQFRKALAEVGRNIMDPNTDPEATRGVTITLKFKPSGTGTVNIEYEVKPKLAAMRKSKTRCQDRPDRNVRVWSRAAPGGGRSGPGPAAGGRG